MKLRNIIYITFSILLLACAGNKDKELPKVSIQPETMLKIMTDMSKAERMTMDNNLNKEERKQLMQDYQQSILKHYNVSPETYEKELQIYFDNPKLMQKLSK